MLRFHHNEMNFRRGTISEDWSIEDAHEFDELIHNEDIEKKSIPVDKRRVTIRKRIEDLLERKKNVGMDPYAEDYYYEEE